jgi:hypothetical protein
MAIVDEGKTRSVSSKWHAALRSTIIRAAGEGDLAPQRHPRAGRLPPISRFAQVSLLTGGNRLLRLSGIRERLKRRKRWLKSQDFSPIRMRWNSGESRYSSYFFFCDAALE